MITVKVVYADNSKKTLRFSGERLLSDVVAIIRSEAPKVDGKSIKVRSIYI